MSVMSERTSEFPGLLPYHVDELRRSGLSDATIRAAEIRSEVNTDKLARLLNWNSYPKRMGPAIVFPYHGPDGGNSYVRIKPDNPRTQKGKKPAKYESPKGLGNQLYIPPGVADKLDRPEAELWITEGEKKSLCATQRGCVPWSSRRFRLVPRQKNNAANPRA